jgi:hypothetical protein
MNQNFTVLFVFRRTLRIIIDTNRWRIFQYLGHKKSELCTS